MNPLETIQQGVDDLKAAVGDLGGATIGDALGLTNSLQGIAKKFGDIVGQVVEGVTKVFKDVGFLKELLKILFDILDQIIRALADALKSIAGQVQDALKYLVRTFLKALWDALHAADLPLFKGGPTHALLGVKEFGEVLHLLGQLESIEDRFEMVANSVEKLVAEVGGGPAAAVIGTLSQQLLATIKPLLRGSDPQQALSDLIIALVFPSGSADGESEDIWGWFRPPTGLQPGLLHKWLNESPFRFPEPARIRVEREFRTRLVAAADAYLRARDDSGPVPAPISRSDSRPSHGAITDALCIFLDTTIQFIFEPECFPVADIDLPNFEAIGVKFARLVVGQIRILIRAAISVVLRGLSFFSFNNELLIEVISIAISAAFSAILEAIIRNLTWSLQVVSRYAGDAFNGGLAETFSSAERAPAFPDGSNQEQVIEYAVLNRVAGVPLASGAIQGEIIKGLLRDFAAYLDATYRQFRVGDRFAPTQADAVTITEAFVRDQTLVVRAKTSATSEVPFALPRPVLRAYYCCHVVAMRHGDGLDDPYELRLPVESLRRCAEVVVLSSRGGRASRVVRPFAPPQPNGPLWIS